MPVETTGDLELLIVGRDGVLAFDGEDVGADLLLESKDEDVSNLIEGEGVSARVRLGLGFGFGSGLARDLPGA